MRRDDQPATSAVSRFSHSAFVHYFESHDRAPHCWDALGPLFALSALGADTEDGALVVGIGIAAEMHTLGFDDEYAVKLHLAAFGLRRKNE
ncbi:MAG: hypothetical protein ABIR80_21125, partial [Opitutaceae bacterium]